MAESIIKIYARVIITMGNLTCGGAEASTYSTFYELNNDCSTSKGATVSATTILYGCHAALSFLLVFVTYLYYNSVTVLNYSIHINAISNNWWIIYFVVAGARSVVQSVQYSHKYGEEGYFLTNLITVGFEVLLLCLALNYQRRFRTSAFITREIDRVGKYGPGRSLCSDFKGLCRAFTSSGTVFMFQFLFIVGALLLFRLLNDQHAELFWLYVSFLLLLNVSAFIVCAFIAARSGVDEPAVKTKVYFFLSVLLAIPERLPLFFWIHCTNMKCWGDVMTLFDLWIIFKMMSFLCIFRALHLEYNRLKHECQYAMLNEVQGYNFE